MDFVLAFSSGFWRGNIAGSIDKTQLDLLITQFSFPETNSEFVIAQRTIFSSSYVQPHLSVCMCHKTGFRSLQISSRLPHCCELVDFLQQKGRNMLFTIWACHCSPQSSDYNVKQMFWDFKRVDRDSWVCYLKKRDRLSQYSTLILQMNNNNWSYRMSNWPTLSLILISFLNTNILFVISKTVLEMVRYIICCNLYSCIPALFLCIDRHVSLKFWES